MITASHNVFHQTCDASDKMVYRENHALLLAGE